MGRCVDLMTLFFYKQKTAYELRISDGSADVVSSYLIADRPVVAVGHLDCAEEGHDEAPVDSHAAVAAIGEAAIAHRQQLAVLRGRHLELVDQIGRASCRARVCQYV